MTLCTGPEAFKMLKDQIEIPEGWKIRSATINMQVDDAATVTIERYLTKDEAESILDEYALIKIDKEVG